jgi:hypothetical protein
MKYGVGTKDEYQYLQHLVNKYCGIFDVDLNNR